MRGADLPIRKHTWSLDHLADMTDLAPVRLQDLRVGALTAGTYPPGEFTRDATPGIILSLNPGRPVRSEMTYGRRSLDTEIETGTLCISPAEMDYRCTMDDSYAAVSVYLPQSLFTAVLNRTPHEQWNCGQISQRHNIGDPTLTQLMSILVQEAGSGFQTDRIYAESIVSAIAARVAVHYGGLSKTSPSWAEHRAAPTSVHRAITYIDQNLATQLSTTSIAMSVGLSASHLSRLFKRVTGETVHGYVMRRRVEYARELLEHDASCTVEQVARLAGFADASHFRRRHRRLYGHPPRRSENEQSPERAGTPGPPGNNPDHPT
ncbi:MAG: AraC family transcriptional regulator [Planctomycetota bacterium]